MSVFCFQVVLIISSTFKVNAAIFSDGDKISIKGVALNKWCGETSGDKVVCTSAARRSDPGYVFKVKDIAGDFQGIQGLFNGITSYCVNYGTEMKCDQATYTQVETNTKYIFEAGTGTNVVIKQRAGYCTPSATKITCYAAQGSAPQWEVCVWDEGLTTCTIPGSPTNMSTRTTTSTTTTSLTTLTTSTTSTFTTSTTSTTTPGICTVPDPVANQSATLLGGLVKVDDYACEHRNHFATLDLAIEACKALDDCQAVSNTRCNMQNIGGVVGICRGGPWISRKGDCIYMKDTP